MNRIIFYSCVIVILGFLSCTLFPGGTSAASKKRFREQRLMCKLSTSLSEYAGKNGHYPNDLSVFRGRYPGEWDSYLDGRHTLYCKPETINPPNNFVLLIIKIEEKTYILFADGTIKLMTNKGTGTIYPWKDEIAKCLSEFHSDYQRLPYFREELISYATTKTNIHFSSDRYEKLTFRNDLEAGSFEARYTLTNNSGGGQYITSRGQKPPD